jgi:hypothetical protein
VIATLLSLILAADTNLFLEQERARSLSADPNAPGLSAVWRGAMRGVAGGIIPLGGQPGEPGLRVAITPLIELHNPVGADPFLVPFALWRARLALEVGWRRPWREGTLYYGLGLEHESDHITLLPGLFPLLRTSSYLSLNSASLRGEYTTTVNDWVFTPGGTVRLSTLSCTKDTFPCDLVLGSTSPELQLDATALGPPVWAGVRPLVAGAASWIFESRHVTRERRAVLRLGLLLQNPGRSGLQLFATLLVGNDVGYLRNDSIVQVGGGIRWAPSPTSSSPERLPGKEVEDPAPAPAP